MTDKILGLASSKLGVGKVNNKRKILTINNSLTYKNREEVEATFKDCLDLQKTEIIIDFAKVSFLDSEGLELLLEMHNELNLRGGALKLVQLDALCLDILKVTQLINVFRIYEDMQKAIKDVL
jgi:anti-anti-sigma factor